MLLRQAALPLRALLVFVAVAVIVATASASTAANCCSFDDGTPPSCGRCDPVTGRGIESILDGTKDRRIGPVAKEHVLLQATIEKMSLSRGRKALTKLTKAASSGIDKGVGKCLLPEEAAGSRGFQRSSDFKADACAHKSHCKGWFASKASIGVCPADASAEEEEGKASSARETVVEAHEAAAASAVAAAPVLGSSRIQAGVVVQRLQLNLEEDDDD